MGFRCHTPLELRSPLPQRCQHGRGWTLKCSGKYGRLYLWLFHVVICGLVWFIYFKLLTARAMFFGNTLKEKQQKNDMHRQAAAGTAAEHHHYGAGSSSIAPSKNLVAALLVPVEQPLRICLVRTSWCQFHAITSRWFHSLSWYIIRQHWG